MKIVQLGREEMVWLGREERVRLAVKRGDGDDGKERKNPHSLSPPCIYIHEPVFFFFGVYTFDDNFNVVTDFWLLNLGS